jgi:hypothetical protein
VYNFPRNVIRSYVRKYRRELTVDNITKFLLDDEGNHSIDTKIKYLFDIFELSDDYKFNLDLSPEHIIGLHKECRFMRNVEFISFINSLSNTDDIFCGEDIGGHTELLESRSFKIFQTLY